MTILLKMLIGTVVANLLMLNSANLNSFPFPNPNSRALEYNSKADIPLMINWNKRHALAAILRVVFLL